MPPSVVATDGHACAHWLASMPRDTVMSMPVQTATLNVLLLGTLGGLAILKTLPRAVQAQTILVLPTAMQADVLHDAAWLPLRDVLCEEDPCSLSVLRAHASHPHLGAAQACTARALCLLLHGTARDLSVELLTRIFDGATLPLAVRALAMHRATLHRRLIDEGSPTAKRITALVLVLSCAAACAVADVSLAAFVALSSTRSLERFRRLLARHQISLRETRRISHGATPRQIVEHLVNIGRPLCLADRRPDPSDAEGPTDGAEVRHDDYPLSQLVGGA